MNHTFRGITWKPDDNYGDLKDFNHDSGGEPSVLEEMHLEYQKGVKPALKAWMEIDPL